VVVNRGIGSFADRLVMSSNRFFDVILNDALGNSGDSHWFS